MTLKKINENPKITDVILLEIDTPGADDCFVDNPYKVDSVTIYYVERNFLGSNHGEYNKVVVPDELKAKLIIAKKNFCSDPTPDNASKLSKIEGEIESSTQTNKFYYKDRVAIKVIGTEGFPAWLSTDQENAQLTLIEEDDDGNPIFGHFTYEWDAKGGIREGDYFVCWTWTPLAAGEKLSAHVHFSIAGDGLAVSTIPSHETPDGKYETLLERYLPEMYKSSLVNEDLTPQTTQRFNLAVAKGFTFLEDMANQIIDLFDANALHESMLMYLSNTFAIKLKSSDPTLWRRQIKEAVPLFKKKGTLIGLKEAFAQSGMTLNSFTQYWQLVSPYTWVEVFKVVDTPTFELYKNQIITPIDEDNFELWLKREDSTEYTELSKDYVSFEEGNDGIIRMTWIGENFSSNSVALYKNDLIKVMYQYNVVPGYTEQSLENYIKTLPLMDQRDEDEQEYPPKNWNVRLIEEDDPLFPILIPVRHPFQSPLMFGFIRTEFAYSENIYNAEEYNGSIRPSYDPCFIDKSFLDPCGACLSSSYSVDIAVEELSNDRMLEAQDILREYTPFHAQIHSINFMGEVNEFIQSPTEQIDTLVTMDYSQIVLSGNSNPFFNRSMNGALSNWVVTRDDLTDKLTVLSGKMGTAYNDQVTIIVPDYKLSNLGVISNNHILEVLAPSANAGTYTIDHIDGHMAKVTSAVIEPVDQTAFTFVLSNIIYGNSVSIITQKDLIQLSDQEIDFNEISVKTQWDVANTPNYTGGAWKVLIPAYSATAYEIIDVQNNILILDGDSNLPTVDTISISYSLLDDEDNVIETSTTGDMAVERRGYVNLNDIGILNVNEFIKAGDYLHYAGDEYLITEIDGSNFWIDEYSDGDAIGVTIHTRRRLVNNGVGYFGYRGLHLTTFADHESEFEMVNGSNPPDLDDITDDSKFKENFMFKIGNELYKIIAIDKKEVVLSGREQNWMTLSAGGTIVAYSVIHFPKKQVNVGFTVFDHLDRDGQDPVIREIYSEIDSNTAIEALSTPKSSGIQENSSHEEGISIIIETRSGEILEGEL